MNRFPMLSIALLLAACATTPDEDVDAVKDFIEVNELPETRSIRSFEGFEQEVLDDVYVIVKARKEYFLLEYYVPCRYFPSETVKPDVRRDAHAIYAGSDTFRGCRIKTLYALSPDQAAELREIGAAPGE